MFVEATGLYVRAGGKFSVTATHLSTGARESDLIWKIRDGYTEKEIIQGRGKISFVMSLGKEYIGKQVQIAGYAEWDSPRPYILPICVLPGNIYHEVKSIKDESGIEGPFYPGDVMKFSVSEYQAPKSTQSLQSSQVPDHIRHAIQWYVSLDEGPNEVLLIRNKIFTNEQIQFRLPSAWAGKKVKLTASLRILKKATVELKVKAYPIVADLYKMPGLNDACTDIADDMTYGRGNPHSRPIYDTEDVERYIERYRLQGADPDPDPVFSNAAAYKEDSDENRKAIYTIDDLTSIGAFNLNDGNIAGMQKLPNRDLFERFTKMCVEDFTSSDPQMQSNIVRMISRFRSNQGGVYEDKALNKYVNKHPSTLRYCAQLEAYLQNELHRHHGTLRGVEDTELHAKESDSKYAMENRKRKRPGKEKFLTPVYNGVPLMLGGVKEERKNLREGITIAVNDVMAARVDITGYELQVDGSYDLHYRLILWDHFGLDRADLAGMGKTFHRAKTGFGAWLLLQHYRGYKPFVTKMTVERLVQGNIYQQADTSNLPKKKGFWEEIF